MANKVNLMPADFYDDDVKANNSKINSSNEYNRKVKNSLNANTITWKENFEKNLNSLEVDLFFDIKREFCNGTNNKDLQNLIMKSYDEKDPVELTLYFCSKLSEKSSLIHILLETLSLKKDLVVSDEMKHFAFNMFSQMTASTFGLAVKAFHLVDSKEMFIDKIKTIAQHPWLTQAAIVAMELDLCNDIPIEDILVPLFLENKISTYLQYLDRAKQLQLPMIYYLDSLMESDYEFERERAKYGIKNLPLKNLKQIKIQIFKMINRYGLSGEDAPLATKYQNTKDLKFIIHEYYENEKISKEIFHDKVTEIANKGDYLKVLLIEQCCERGYVNDGRKWKEYYPEVNVDLSRYSQYSLTFEQTIANDYDDFYGLPIDDSCITFIDNEKLYFDMLEKLPLYEEAGVDCEQNANNELSIIQIAVKDEIFIIDAIHLRSILSKETWQQFNEAFLSNSKILKLGCAIFNDIATIEKYLPPIKVDRKASYIDLSVFGKHLLSNVPVFKFPYHQADRKFFTQLGLSTLTKLCFNKGLNKALAISNWSKRPLRNEQIIYAALDAYSALDIFRIINDILESFNLTYKDIKYEKLAAVKEKLKK